MSVVILALERSITVFVPEVSNTYPPELSK